MKESTIRIFLFDNHELVRAGLHLLIEKREGMEVVGEAGNFSEGLEIIAKVKPNITLLDLNFDNCPTSDVISGIINAYDQTRVILLIGVNNPITTQRAVESGVVGVVLKSQSPQTLFKAIEKVNEGEVWLERSMIANVLSRLSRNDKVIKPSDASDNIDDLSEREKQIIGYIGQGYKNKKIAEHLCISETTVRHHLSSIYSKLGVTDRLELLVYAHRYGLVKSTHPT
jgi:DNA-binding NarL/FixJ family response regulator